MIDASGKVEEKASMVNARHSLAGVVVHKNYILAIGGVDESSKNTSTELYDTEKNIWSAAPTLLKPSADSCAVVMNDRCVYLLQGQNLWPTDKNVAEIAYLDVGALSSSKNNLLAKSIMTTKWEYLLVKNKEFVSQKPACGLALSLDTILVFGGEGTCTFNIKHKSGKNGESELEVLTVQDQKLDSSNTFMLKGSDFVGVTLKDKGLVLAIDAPEELLYAHDMRAGTWAPTKLSDLQLMSA